ncbi:MAG: flotillin domain-containing protein, partial [Dongiaceae bacterium]
VQAQENVVTAREKAIADRRKLIELIEAELQAEREALKIVSFAEANRKAAEERAEGEKVTADAAKYRYAIDAEGNRALNEAENLRSDASRRSALHRRLVENLPEIIRESVKPIEKIESIRILQVDGLPGLSGFAGTEGSGGDGDLGAGGDGGGPKGRSLADSAVNAALRYRAQAPFVDDLLKQIGISGDAVGNLSNLLHGPAPKNVNPAEPGPKKES